MVVTENAFDGRVDRLNDALIVDRQNAVGGGVHNRTITGFRDRGLFHRLPRKNRDANQHIQIIGPKRVGGIFGVDVDNPQGRLRGAHQRSAHHRTVLALQNRGRHLRRLLVVNHVGT